ncbi:MULTISPECIES: two-component system regulatory protein YycI [unclassified Mesobacillus]|uniref:two-component system regulatory protein YycI n=1 Tax=unclassified Mesobacillus TaxID=2675270 RepID=UPI0020410673|nr:MULTISPECIES: two-component system regulatory protein YycI [unclassified Mesobacillus]MCM3123607.1 two-component system regulatory protein YycI [Mesobacillus sp. MER 33]MCM3234378.1 two-component system regulatory protein YycI [Mesobacillus sp. MER 48]
MDWSRIKTIFILTFLVLDIYLVYQFMNTRDAAQYEIPQEAPLEEKLKNDDISYGELPEAKNKEQYLSVRAKVFTTEETEKFKGQSISLGDGTSIEAKLEKPLKLTSKFQPAELSAFIKANIFAGEQYKFWSKNDEAGTITYYQEHNQKTFYYNSNAKLTFYFNEDLEVTSYKQTYLEIIDELSDAEELLPPLRALETLYKKGLLKPKSKITDFELGYSTLVSLTASHVVTPTWRIEVNGKENLFVHAFEGRVIPLTDGENKTTE